MTSVLAGYVIFCSWHDRPGSRKTLRGGRVSIWTSIFCTTPLSQHYYASSIPHVSRNPFSHLHTKRPAQNVYTDWPPAKHHEKSLVFGSTKCVGTLDSPRHYYSGGHLYWSISSVAICFNASARGATVCWRLGAYSSPCGV